MSTVLQFTFICGTIIVCYVIGFMMGQVYEKSKQKDIEQAEADKKANKKITLRVIR